MTEFSPKYEESKWELEGGQKRKNYEKFKKSWDISWDIGMTLVWLVDGGSGWLVCWLDEDRYLRYWSSLKTLNKKYWLPSSCLAFSSLEYFKYSRSSTGLDFSQLPNIWLNLNQLIIMRFGSVFILYSLYPHDRYTLSLFMHPSYFSSIPIFILYSLIPCISMPLHTTVCPQLPSLSLSCSSNNVYPSSQEDL